MDFDCRPPNPQRGRSRSGAERVPVRQPLAQRGGVAYTGLMSLAFSSSHRTRAGDSSDTKAAKRYLIFLMRKQEL
jgi:hypothetical protein